MSREWKPSVVCVTNRIPKKIVPPELCESCRYSIGCIHKKRLVVQCSFYLPMPIFREDNLARR